MILSIIETKSKTGEAGDEDCVGRFSHTVFCGLMYGNWGRADGLQERLGSSSRFHIITLWPVPRSPTKALISRAK